MGKNKHASAKRAKAATKPDADDFPSFDEQALSTLTEKIEKGLGNKGLKQENAGKGRDSEGSKPKKANSSRNGRGTKRDAQGNAKKPDSRGQSASHKNGGGKDDGSDLLQEILALGGTEDDLDLVAGAPADDEDLEAEAGAPDEALRKELANFVASLGIEAGNTGEPDEQEIEEEEAEDEWEEASEQESPLEQVKAARKVTAPTVPGSKNADAPSSKDANRLIFEARADWHATSLPELPQPSAKESSIFRDTVKNLKEYASSLLEADCTIYTSKHLSSSSSHRFLSTIMTSGTLSDKVSALTLVVQESPVHTMKSFESLLGLAKKRSRGQAVTALGALKDLLGPGAVLPANRRLRTFAAQPGLIGTLEDYPISNWKVGQPLPGFITKAHLISWAYEDWLKESYFDMLKILEGWCNDEVEYARSRAVTYVYELLRDKPEQESNLLRLLVNKLGDPDKKIASRTSYLLLQLQTSHPGMKLIVIRSMETELLLRPNQSSHARYYAINTLNQTILKASEDNVAQKLLDIYFELFVSLLKKPDIQKVLEGPVVNSKGQVQGGGGAMGKKAKAKAVKAEEAKYASEETTEKMISAVLTGVNRAFPFSNVKDHSLEKHMDTLFRITHSSNFNTSIQALMLIEQLATAKHLSVDRFYRCLYESLLDPRLIMSSKHALYLNLMFRALRCDLNIKRVKAFVKRMMQIITLHQPAFICGIIYLIRELEQTFPALRSLFNDPEVTEEDEEEVFRDVPENGASIVETPAIETVGYSSEAYDGKKRDPEHSHADKSCLWEILPFLNHFHPSVSMFANRLLSNETMPPKPDLISHTLTHFLDRFVYRNAKAKAEIQQRGGSIMQPLSGGDNKAILISNRAGPSSQQSVNSEAFWRKKVEDVAVDEVFFHKYFSQIGKGKQSAAAKKKAKAAEGSDVEEDAEEDEIWKALKNSRPEVEGVSEDEDSDLDLDDLEAEFSDEDEDMDGSDGDVVLGSDFADSDDDAVAEVEDDDEHPFSSEEDENTLFEKEEQQNISTEKKPETSREKRKKMNSLPIFASAEEYAQMLDNDDDEDV